MLTPERITALPTAEELEAGYYVLVDSPTLGTRKIAVENFIPPEPDYLYKWDFTKSLIDEVQGVEAYTNLVTRTNNGLIFNAALAYVKLNDNNNYIDLSGKTIEIDVPSFDFKGNTSYHIRFLMNTNDNALDGTGALIYRKNTGWSAYGFTSNSGTSRAWDSLYNSNLGMNDFNNKTIKIVNQLDGKTRLLYLNDLLVGTLNGVYLNGGRAGVIYIGGFGYNSTNGDQCYDMTISGIRIYENEEV